MNIRRFLPNSAAFIVGNQPPSQAYLDFFREVANANLASDQQVAELIARFAALDLGSLEALAQAQGVGIAVKIPGSWVFRRINGAVGRIVVNTGDAVATNPLVDLALLTDSGIGAALWKFTRDQWGRVEGTEASTTDDLTEGVANLYFTVERAQDAVGSAVDGTGDVPLSYDDGTGAISAALSAPVLASLALADSALQPAVPIVARGAGAPYVLTATPAPIDMGTSDPVIVIDDPGTYLIRGFLQLELAAGTVVSETISATFSRTNNTPADLPDAAITLAPAPATAASYTIANVQLPEVVYTTTNSDDELTILASISAALGAGDIQISAAQILAHRIS